MDYKNPYLKDYAVTHELEEWQKIAGRLVDLIPMAAMYIPEVQAFSKEMAKRLEDVPATD